MSLVPGFGSRSMPTGDDPDATLLRAAAMAVVYEATLQDLLRYSNEAVHRLLLERNELLRERVLLGAKEIHYSEVDFLNPPPPIRPYIIRGEYLLKFRGDVSQGGRRPADRRYLDASVQTDDPDSTLNDIDTSDLADRSDGESATKKRRRE